MSPDRLSVIAPFINRSYATPAQCEAACPTGQCLPYRGASGPAMACVVRCDRDDDCPKGLACNCREPGSACRPIATTPHDTMARICLSPRPAPEPPAAPTGAPVSAPGN